MVDITFALKVYRLMSHLWVFKDEILQLVNAEAA